MKNWREKEKRRKIWEKQAKKSKNLREKKINQTILKNWKNETGENSNKSNKIV